MLNFVSGMICRSAFPVVVLRVHVQFVPTYQYRSDSLPPPPPCVPFLHSGACALGRSEQMGFKRQLSSAEIFEQAYHFSQELNARGERLSNVVRQRMILGSVSLLRGASVSAA